MLKFDFNDNSKKIRNIFTYDFAGNITNFKYYENQNEKIIFFVKKNSVEFLYLNLNELEYNMKQINLKQDYEIFNEENIFLKEVFILDEFFLFFTNKDEFILFPDDLLKIFKSKLVEEEKEKNDTESDSEKNSNNDEEKRAILEKLIPSFPKTSNIVDPVHIDYGVNTIIGEHCFFNFNLTILDTSNVIFEDYVYVGPN
jgi:glutamyl/glutaminyl-tRNA synthetase